ncbi:MAG: hypothetical protein ABTD50_23635 [Polyangiaceae bacterium]
MTETQEPAQPISAADGTATTPNTPPKTTSNRKRLLSITSASACAVAGLVGVALHKTAEKVGEKGVDRLFGAAASASTNDNLPHRKIAGDWCVVTTYDGGVRMLADCFADATACAKLASELGRMFIWKSQCMVVPPTTPMWCTVKAWSDVPVDPPTTWCYFDNDACQLQGELCFPTTKATVAR